MKPGPFAKALVRWYRRRARDLPWRRSAHPWRIWVSEVMLQQTRIEAVIPYYRRFLRRFPTVRALAAARLDDVLKLWEGLGYYARARNLRRAAKKVAAGRLPKTAAEWAVLPGVGRYTAAAIASITAGEKTPVIDGNVKRVSARLLKLREPNPARIEPLLQRAIATVDAGDFNQAIMELGQVVCAPRSPRCPVCPVRKWCKGFASGKPGRYPARRKAKSVPHYEIAVGVCSRGDKVLVSKRKPEGLLGGLWEFPGGKIRRGETAKRALVRELREEAGLKVEVDRPLVVVPHRYSHFSVRLHAFTCRPRSGRARPLASAALRWVPRRSLRRLAFPAANRKILQALGVGSRTLRKRVQETAGAARSIGERQ